MTIINAASDSLHNRLFNKTPEYPTRYQLEQIKDILEPWQLSLNERGSEYVDIPLPDFCLDIDSTINQATQDVGGHLLDQLDNFYSTPNLKPVHYPIKSGWFVYDGKQWKTSKPPTNQTLILDLETVEVHTDMWQPTCLIAINHLGHTYLWNTDFSCMPSLIPFSTGNLIIGHNISYDRSYLDVEYLPEDSGNRFFDTMSAFITTRGLTNQQRGLYALSQQEEYNYLQNLDWVNETATNSLASVYEFYTGKTLNKGVRDQIVGSGLGWVIEPNNRQAMLGYCYDDVRATQLVFEYTYGELKKQTHPASIVGRILLGSFKIPLSHTRYPTFFTKCDTAYQDILDNVEKTIIEIANNLLDNPNQVSEHQRQHLDWTPLKSGKNKGLPKWYTKLKDDVTLTKRVIPILLGIEYKGYPVYWVNTDSRTGGFYANNEPIPHPESNTQLTTCLFAKGFSKDFDSETLTSKHDNVKQLIASIVSAINWKQNRGRLYALKVHEVDGVPVCIPRTIVSGTVTGRCTDSVFMVMANPKEKRIGTEFKSMVEAPEGYKMVGADISSQELWLGASFGDSVTGVCGSTPMSRALLTGSSTDKTDCHSLMATKAGISRDDAKVLNYGMQYGMAIKGATELLYKVRKIKDMDKAREDAEKFSNAFKGQKRQGRYFNGMMSEALNVIQDRANLPDPQTPYLGNKITKSLKGSKDFVTTRNNFQIQAQGSDMRDVITLLTHWLFKKFDVDGFLVLFIH